MAQTRREQMSKVDREAVTLLESSGRPSPAVADCTSKCQPRRKQNCRL
jgi:hypothetical protein